MAAEYLEYAQAKIASWKETATTNFYWALDVERDVTNQVKANADLQSQIEKLKVDRQQRDEANLLALNSMKDELGQRKTQYEKNSEAILESHDRMCVAGLIYEDVLKQIDTDLQAVQQMSRSEVTGFGIQSKIIFNLSMTVDALKSKVRQGLPYKKELYSLREEVDKSNDIHLLTAPLLPLAEEGVPTHEHVLVLGKETAESLLRATQSGQMMTNSTKVARSFFHRLKFEVHEPKSAVEAHVAHHHHHHKLDKELLENFSTDLFDSVNQRDYAEALRVAEEATTRLPHGSTIAKEFQGNLDKFKASVVPLMLAQNLFDYCEASLISTRYSFVEPVLEKILAEAQKAPQQGSPVVTPEQA